MKSIVIAVLMFFSINIIAQQNEGINPKLEALLNETNQKVLQQTIAELENGSAEDLDLLIQYYSKDSVKRAATTKLLLKKYPESQQAMFIRVTSFMTTDGDPEKTETLYNQMASENPDINMDIEKAIVALTYAEIPDRTKSMQYINTIEDPVYKVAAIDMLLEIIAPVNIKMALDIVDKELEGVLKLKGQITLSEPMKLDPKMIYGEFIKNYGKLLFKAGNDREAYKYTLEAYKELNMEDKELSENYAFLSASLDGNYEEALPILVNAVKEGKNDKRFIDQIRIGYTMIYPEKDANAFIVSLQKGFIDELRSQLIKQMIDEPAPDFFVTDVNGNRVTLSDFKGVTLVLDFWATWCGPCVASFPAMQLAEDRYANDSGVKFLFIHTWENVKDPLNNALQFLSKRNYDFDLYMDTIDPVTKSSPAATAFNVSGIPAKFIIDEQGRIRFRIEGFEGTDEAAAEEVIQMVEMTRQSIKP